VTEVTAALRDEADGSADYPVPIVEVVEAARAKVVGVAAQAEIDVCAAAEPDLMVNARVASLAGLVLANLIANALEASPRGATVRIEARRALQDEAVEILVRDTGPGLPPPVQAQLFRPLRSGKRGGGGVGLAISLRLAKHAGGNLELVRSEPGGTEFRLTVPVMKRA
jgi:signal transduction histidine kinase